MPRRASVSGAEIVEFIASSRAAPASLAAELPVRRIIVSGFGQFRVAPMHPWRVSAFWHAHQSWLASHEQRAVGLAAVRISSHHQA